MVNLNIKEIIKNLFGNIQPVGETIEDKKRFENLDKYEILFDYCVNELVNCAKNKNDNRYSVNEIGEKAFDILQIQLEYIKDELRIILENQEGK